MTCGDLALDSCAQFLAAAEHRLIPSRVRLLVICFVKLVISRFGPLLVRIRLLVVMLGWGCQLGWRSSCPAYLLLPLSFRSFLGWVGLCASLSQLVKGEWFISFVIYGYQGAEEDLRRCNSLISFCKLFLLRLRLCVLVSLCLLVVIFMLILL